GERTAEEARWTDEERVRRGGKERPEPDEVAAGGRRGRARERHRDEAPRLPLEEEQLDRERHRRDRRGEGRRHAARGAGHEERLPLGAGELQELRDHRAEG